MTTIRMKAPRNSGGFAHGTVSYPPGDIDVPHDAIDVARSHGYVELATLAGKNEAAPDGPNEAPSTDPEKMARNEMFAYLRAAGVAVTIPITNDALRAIVRDVVAKASDEPTKAPDPVIEPPADGDVQPAA